METRDSQKTETVVKEKKKLTWEVIAFLIAALFAGLALVFMLLLLKEQNNHEETEKELTEKEALNERYVKANADYAIAYPKLKKEGERKDELLLQASKKINAWKNQASTNTKSGQEKLDELKIIHSAEVKKITGEKDSLQLQVNSLQSDFELEQIRYETLLGLAEEDADKVAFYEENYPIVVRRDSLNTQTLDQIFSGRWNWLTRKWIDQSPIIFLYPDPESDKEESYEYSLTEKGARFFRDKKK